MRVGNALSPAAGTSTSRETGLERITVRWLLTASVLLPLLASSGVALRASQAAPAALPPRAFYALLTLHGTGAVLVTLMVTCVVFSYAIRPALPMSPGVLSVAYALTVTGVILVVAGAFGGYGAGWTILYPLPSNPGPVPGWRPWAAGANLSGLMLVVGAFALWCFDYLRVGIDRYGTLGRLLGLDVLAHGATGSHAAVAPAIIAGTVVAVTGLTAMPAGAVAMALVLGELVGGPASNVLLVKNLTFFAGHVLANVQIYIGAGLAYVALPAYTGRPWRATRSVVVAWLATGTLLMLAFFHHLYQDFAQPEIVQVVGHLASYGAAFPPLVVTIFGGLVSVYRCGIRWRTAPLFLYLALMAWAIGGAAAVIDAAPSINQYLHNTQWTPAYFHSFLALGVIFFVVGAVYHLAPALLGRGLSEVVGSRGALLLGIGGWGHVGTLFLSGAGGQPRRYPVTLAGLEWSARAGAAFGVVAAAGMVAVVVDFLRTWWQEDSTR